MHKRTGYEQGVTPSHIYSTTTHFFNGAGTWRNKLKTRNTTIARYTYSKHSVVA